MAEDVIQARRIELVDERGDISCVLVGGAEVDPGEDDRVGMILYGPDGPVSAATISIDREHGRPAILLYTVGGGAIYLGFTSDGRAVLSLEDEDGGSRSIGT